MKTYNCVPPKRLVTKRIIVTGFASGMGFATACRVVSEGAQVALFDFNELASRKALSAIPSENDQVRSWTMDVSKEADVKTAVAEAIEWFGGGIDVLIHLAGILRGSYLSIGEVTVEDWDAVLEVNLKGSFLMAKHVSQYMIQQQSGAIVLTSSGAGVTEGSSSYSYGSSKGGTHGLALTLDRHLSTHGIRVNEVLPGYVETPMMLEAAEEALLNTGDGAVYRTTMDGLSTPKDIAAVMAFLASDDATSVRGTISTT
ncbi:SDR family oxidoreductase [Dehalococcoidia bacterium]|nr:SDR family oxidoreductase [Dehalococcoidia bacterium]